MSGSGFLPRCNPRFAEQLELEDDCARCGETFDRAELEDGLCHACLDHDEGEGEFTLADLLP